MNRTDQERTLQPTSPLDAAPTVSGKLVVILMFLFAAGMTSLLYLYWEMHTRPFRPLQLAIDQAFPGSQPRVVGGRYKSHKASSPNTLRIIVNVDFDPSAEASAARSEQIAHQLTELASRHLDVFAYDLIEVHLLRPVPERDPLNWSKTASPADWGLHPPEDAEAQRSDLRAGREVSR